jgi:hypothetical protein
MADWAEQVVGTEDDPLRNLPLEKPSYCTARWPNIAPSYGRRLTLLPLPTDWRLAVMGSAAERPLCSESSDWTTVRLVSPELNVPMNN